MAIEFYNKSIDFRLKNKLKHRTWIQNTTKEEQRRVGAISVVFCSDEEILEINNEYLNHNYYTDIITFDYGAGDLISGDLFISVDTVRSNSEEYGVEFENELSRVIIHGVLHLIGYKDKSDEEQELMTQKEDYYLKELENLLN